MFPLMGNSRLVVAPCTVRGWVLPTGTRLTVNYAVACFDPAAWRDPFAFVPERNLGEEAATGAGAPAAPNRTQSVEVTRRQTKEGGSRPARARFNVGRGGPWGAPLKSSAGSH